MTRESRPSNAEAAPDPTATTNSQTIAPTDVDALRAELAEARRRGDREAEAELCSRLDVLFVGSAHRRLRDPELLALRRIGRPAVDATSEHELAAWSEALGDLERNGMRGIVDPVVQAAIERRDLMREIRALLAEAS